MYCEKKLDNKTVLAKISDEEIENFTIEINDNLQAFENKIATNIVNSEVYNINKATAKQKVDISSDTLELLKISKEYYEKTGGAFNVAVLGLSRLWGFSTEFSGQYNTTREEPNKEQIDKFKRLSDIEFLILDKENDIIKNSKDNYIAIYDIDEPYIIKSNSEIEIDFGGIAKGYICDKEGEYLKNKGVKYGSLNMLSNIYIIGKNIDENLEKKAWNIDILNPRSQVNNQSRALTIKNVENTAVTTSADNLRSYINNGKIYSHIIDSSTGKPCDNGILSITILGENGAKADIFSTAGFNKKLTKTIELYQENNINSVIITADYKYYITGNLEVVSSNKFYNTSKEDLFTFEKLENAKDDIVKCQKEIDFLKGEKSTLNKKNMPIYISIIIIAATIFVVILLLKTSKNEKK